MSSVRRSQLQTCILLALTRGDASGVAPLARQVDAPRESVSRSLRSLSGQGLVEQQERAWRLTDEGRGVADQLGKQAPLRYGTAIERLMEHQQRMVRIIDPSALRMVSEATIRMDQLEAFGSISAASGLNSTIRNLLGPSSFPAIVETMRLTDFARESLGGLNLSSSSPALDSIARQISAVDAIKSTFAAEGPLSSAASPARSALLDAIGPLAQTQRALLGSIEETLRPDSGVALLLQRDNLGLSRVMADVGWIASSIALVEPPFASVLKGLAPRIGALADSLSAMHWAALDDIVAVALRQPVAASRRVAGVLLPTYGTQRFTTGVRGLLDSDGVEGEDLRQRADSGDDLEDLLAEVDPRFARMLRGARQTLHSDVPDRFRQAAVSVRELMKQILLDLAPEDRFDPRELQQQGHRGHPTRKMRVRFIVDASPEAVDWLDALAQAYDFSIRMLDDETHTRASEDSDRRRMSAESIIQSAESFLRYLLVNRRRADASGFPGPSPKREDG